MQEGLWVLCEDHKTKFTFVLKTSIQLGASGVSLNYKPTSTRGEGRGRAGEG